MDLGKVDSLKDSSHCVALTSPELTEMCLPLSFCVGIKGISSHCAEIDFYSERLLKVGTEKMTIVLGRQL